MSIGVPDTLTVDNSGSYILSIRLRSGGLSFSGYDPTARGSLFYREVEFDRSLSYISSLKDFFFANEFLSWSYKRIYIISLSGNYTIVPNAFVVEGEEMRLLDFCSPVVGKHTLVDNFGDDAKLIYAIDEEVYEFCSRSLAGPLFSHHISSLYRFLANFHPGVTSRRIYAVVDAASLDLICLDKSGLMFANSYPIGQLTDLLYYILYVWKELAFDVERDELHVLADASVRIWLFDSLAPYLRNIKPVEMPSEAFLLGSEASKAPIDLISLFLCES